MPFQRDKWVWWAIVFAISGQTLLSLLLKNSQALTIYGDFVQCALLSLGLVLMLRSARRVHGRRRVFFLLMATGFALWVASQILWTYYEVLARHQVPNPFIGDVVIFIHLVPMMGALTLQIESDRHDELLNLGSVDVLILLSWWLYLYVFAVIPWQFVSNDVFRYGQTFNVLYLTEHAVFLVVVAALWAKSYNQWKEVHGHLLGAAFLYALASYAIGIAIDLHRYYTGSSYDIPLVASEAWFVWVGVLASRSDPQEAPVRTRDPVTAYWASRLATVATLSIPLIGLWGYLLTDVPASVRRFQLVVTLGAMLVMTFLAFLKQHMLTDELATLLRRSDESVETLKRMQTQLVHSEKLASLGQLVAGAAHEINNPLTAILGYTDLLNETTTLDPEQKNIAANILQQARRTKDLVASLLNFSKQTPAMRRPVDINSVVQTALKLSHDRLHAHNIQVITELSCTLPQISVDRNQLLQVFLHVIRNAADAMQARNEGTLTARTRFENGSVVCEFIDRGGGIADPQRVFDPFYTTRAVGKGAGLGLSACYGIVGDHGGSIRCENIADGACFRIELPATSSPQSAPADLTLAHS
jgi:signal transduction histidine kinase